MAHSPHVDPDQPGIAAYADQLSVKAGEHIAFHVSTNTRSYDATIARVGARTDVVWSRSNIRGARHEVPENASTHGCHWPASFELKVSEDWPSGYYVLTLEAAGPSGCRSTGHASFVVRSSRPGRDTTILLQRPTNTENAYNSWGGTTLYNGPNGPGHRVSFDRPFAGFPGTETFLFSIGTAGAAALDENRVDDAVRDAMSAHGRSLTDYCFAHVAQRGERWHLFDAGGLYELRRRGDELDLYDAFANWESCWHTWELPFVKWAERAGYRIDYAVNGDLEFRPDILEHYRLVLSVGHDEYWSSPMRDHLEAYIDNGGNVAFFSGNVAWWQVRSVNIGRDLVCWKDHKRDPLYHRGDHRLLTTVWCHHLIGRPENRLTGVSFAFGGYHRFFDQYQDGLHAYTVHRPDHWVFEGTGLKRGDALGAADRIVSYECDGCELEMVEGRPTPTCRDGTPSTFEVLATAPAGLSMADDSLGIVRAALHGEDSDTPHVQPGAAVLGTYTRGGTVFTAGCTNWSHGLAGGDEAVDRITRNVLDRLSQ